jgi:adapter protein MecA 1/2
MKIEKISNTQIKVILSRKDLEERNLKLAELAYKSDKTMELFREMMEAAVKEFGFSVENIPLMIEAIPTNEDEIMLIVSKVNSGDPTELNLSMVPMVFRDRNFIRKYIEDMPEELSFNDGSFAIYSFEALDDVIRLCARIEDIYEGQSSLYKENGLYYLTLSCDLAGDMSEDSFDALVGEFGTKHISNAASKAYLDEHAELITANKAVEVLAKL